MVNGRLSSVQIEKMNLWINARHTVYIYKWRTNFRIQRRKYRYNNKGLAFVVKPKALRLNITIKYRT